MSVRLRQWKNKEGRIEERWTVDVKLKLPGKAIQRVRDFSPVNTRRGAEQYERQVRQALIDGTYGKEPVAEKTLEQFCEAFLTYSTNNNKPSAVYAKRMALKNHLLPAFGPLRLSAIGMPEVERYKAAKLKAKLSPKSINNHLAVLRKMLNLAVEWRELPYAPKVKQLRVPPQEFRFLSFEEAERLLAAASTRWLPMLTTALRTGLRLGELLALKWEDVDPVAGRLIVRRTLWQQQEGSPKGGRTREVPLGDTVVDALKVHRHLRGDYVFCHDDGRRWSHSEVKDVVPQVCKRAGLGKRLTWHDLRHTFASHLVMRGVALKAVQELLGHATIDMTMRYSHLSPDVKRDAVRLLDRVSTGARGAQEGHKMG